MVSLNFEDQELEDIFNALHANDEGLFNSTSAAVTLLDELHDDHATNIGAINSIQPLVNELKLEFNKLITDVGTLYTSITGITAKLDADAGVTDTDYASTHDPVPATAIAAVSSDASGAAVTLTATKPAAPAALGTTVGT